MIINLIGTLWLFGGAGLLCAAIDNDLFKRSFFIQGLIIFLSGPLGWAMFIFGAIIKFWEWVFKITSLK